MVSNGNKPCFLKYEITNVKVLCVSHCANKDAFSAAIHLIIAFHLMSKMIKTEDNIHYFNSLNTNISYTAFRYQIISKIVICYQLNIIIHDLQLYRSCTTLRTGTNLTLISLISSYANSSKKCIDQPIICNNGFANRTFIEFLTKIKLSSIVYFGLC